MHEETFFMLALCLNPTSLSLLTRCLFHTWVPCFLIENAQRLLGCFEYVPYTALTIVLIIKTINARLD